MFRVLISSPMLVLRAGTSIERVVGQAATERVP
jgi:hypothetical protein